jgi:hypothetical protein
VPRPFSAYAALDLEPGADRAAVEEAYRRLIKLYHPDRSGGDGMRAAEINRAYRELRSGPVSETAPVSRPSQSRLRRKQRRRTPRWPLIVAGVILLALMQSDGLMQQGSSWANQLVDAGAPIPTSLARSNVPRNSLLDGPVHAADIAESIEEAIRIVKSGDEQALTDRSRDCHRKLRLDPQLALLDRCAAFDSTVAALLDRDPGQDTGQFNASSVTARQLTAASLMSGDYLAIERRLNRIRSQVELALMPPALPPVQPENLMEDVDTVAADIETAGVEP